MNVLRRAAQLTLVLYKAQAIAAVRLYSKLGFYKKLYTACGIPGEVAARLEEEVLDAVRLGIEDQHALTERWVRGEFDFASFVDQYITWFAEHTDRCSRITVGALCRTVEPDRR